MQPSSSWSASSSKEVDFTSGAVSWECSRDLSKFVNDMLDRTGSPLRGLIDNHLDAINVLELGCGNGLPLCELVLGMRRVGYTGRIHACFQDMYSKTIDEVTRPFVADRLAGMDVEFVSSDWEAFHPSQPEFQIILSSECIYREDLFSSHEKCISKYLSRDGLCFLAAKRYYFGCGGGTIAFADFCANEWPACKIELVEVIENGMSNTREIIQLSIL